MTATVDANERVPADGAAAVVDGTARPAEDRLPRGLILRTIVATVMIGTSLCFATYVITRGRMLALRPSFTFPERSLGPPHEVANVRQELFRIANPRPTVKDRQRAELERFGWVDRQQRIIHMPIEEAMRLVAARGGRQR